MEVEDLWAGQENMVFQDKQRDPIKICMEMLGQHVVFSSTKWRCTHQRKAEHQLVCMNMQDRRLRDSRVKHALEALSEYQGKLPRKQQTLEDRKRENENTKKLEGREQEAEELNQVCDQGMRKDAAMEDQVKMVHRETGKEEGTCEEDEGGVQAVVLREVLEDVHDKNQIGLLSHGDVAMWTREATNQVEAAGYYCWSHL